LGTFQRLIKVDVAKSFLSSQSFRPKTKSPIKKSPNEIMSFVPYLFDRKFPKTAPVCTKQPQTAEGSIRPTLALRRARERPP
jgi:hypothetical protein